jgi:hypothetical protein
MRPVGQVPKRSCAILEKWPITYWWTGDQNIICNFREMAHAPCWPDAQKIMCHAREVALATWWPDAKMFMCHTRVVAQADLVASSPIDHVPY